MKTSRSSSVPRAVCQALRRLAGRAAIGAAMAVSAVHAWAWPDKPVRIVVPAAPGTAPDVAMRLIGDRMAETLKQAVVIDNRPGVGGVVAMRSILGSKDDHALLFVITSTSAIAPVTMKSAADFDYLRDLVPVVRLAQTPLMVVAHNQAPATLEGALRAARERPGQVAFGTPSASTLGALAVRSMSQSAGVQFNEIPFIRPAESLAAVTTGDVSYFIDGISVVLPFVRSGKVKPVAVLSRTKLAGLEAYPLGTEAMPDLVAIGRFGLMAEKQLPPQAAELILKAARAALAHADTVSKLTNLGLYPDVAPASDYADSLKAENELWRGVVKKAGISPE